ncbi:MAG: hypothetical protein PHP35_02775 [Candidatus Colwellbacteria bacterium]|nr:hypothetical protein [Candidatus Colwellbacteria bacterium]
MKNISLKSCGPCLWIWKAIVSVIIIGIVACAVFYGFFYKKPYVAVYLITGDVYYGKATFFPKLTLDDAVFLQKGNDGSLSVQKLSDLLWKPIDPMVIERDQVIFWMKLDSTSPVIDAIEGRIPQQQQQQQQQVPTEQQESNQQQNGQDQSQLQPE